MAVHLGGQLRILGTDRTENYTSSLGFSRANRGHGHRKRRGWLYENKRPYLRIEPIPGTRTLYNEKINLPGSLRRRLPSPVCVPARGPEGPISVSEVGNINPIPFRSAARQTRACVCVSARRSLRNGVLRSLGRLTMSTAVHMETLLS
ncbi:hypothetical protein JTE90_011990 [Oedothorax gibbosus]|uniref:Ribosomal protein L2 n=1 Tax=Oedothorax gibbosus TaxID=931172 RepID=A0AAV6TGK8_9ARAC|nr:hypothetical protein JTE90_011990 [Oedothorax gibbosus]